jgi:hypothetical protein
MTYYFIYTNLGHAPRPADKFDWTTLRTNAPSGSYEVSGSDVHKVGVLLNNNLANALVVKIENQTEAVMFKMMQDTFIYHTKSKPKLELILVDVDWAAVLAEGANIEAMVFQQNARKSGHQVVTKMTKLFNKFYDQAIAAGKFIGSAHNDNLTAYSQTLDKQVEQYRAGNKAETAKLAKERTKLKKKLLSYTFK